jgi:PadR family transcriptional regulator PadR
MRLLSRKEEMLLLAIWKLQQQENAYGVKIREYIEKLTGVRWVFGAIYSPLGRLLDHSLVEAYESSPLPEPGGRRKTLYRLTTDGKKALKTIKELNTALWQDSPLLMEKDL